MAMPFILNLHKVLNMIHKNILDVHNESQKMEVFVFNVGQGDHIMLKFPGFKYGIIDFFYDGNENIVEPPCLSYFKELKHVLNAEEFKKIAIAFFCISHTDKDHIKGVSETMQWLCDNGVTIEDVWLSAARDEAEMTNFLRKKIPDLIKKKFNSTEKWDYASAIRLLESKLSVFFDYFFKWKSNLVANGVHKRGEYLADIKSLRKPTPDCHAINVGPLTTQLEDYLKAVDIEVAKKLLGIVDKDNQVDKNHISHILNIKFGTSSLLFGGDTHRDIWEACLDRYHDRSYDYLDLHGELKSQFIKVSHHGSRNSTSKIVWQQIIAEDREVFLSISAGTHKGYGHPHAETISDIRSVRNDAKIQCTNICSKCLLESPFDQEYHVWYDNYRNRHKNKKVTKENIMIEQTIAISTIENNTMDSTDNYGLFAYIYEVSAEVEDEIKVKIAMTKSSFPKDCFYTDHLEKLNASCQSSAIK